MKCITRAWDLHENELRGFLLGQVKDPQLSEDLLQDVFVKALAENDKFCTLENTRAWLYRVTRNRLIDYYRTHKILDDVPEELPDSKIDPEPVVNLSKCLPTALQQLSEQDRDIIEQCDLDGMSQSDYAELRGLTLVATKSRIQRARVKLENALKKSCGIIFDEQGNVCCFDSNCE